MGILIAFIIIALWSVHLFYILTYVDVNFTSLLFYVHILIQAYLYTGLFITGHDAMHGTVSKNKLINRYAGSIAAFLFAGLSYRKLLKNHFAHHHKPGEDDDPDYSMNSQNFFVWWFLFMKRYLSVIQIITMAVIFNVLKLWFNEMSIWFFWVLPVVLSTFQLFYFGTYKPHRRPHTDDMLPHKARTQIPNHLLAMLSCYFFGYHYEHHENPRIPWWQLYKEKNKLNF